MRTCMGGVLFWGLILLILYIIGEAVPEKDSCQNTYFEGVTDRKYSFEGGCKLKYKGEWMTLKEYNDNYGF